jgi:hypothetical protein
MAYAWPALFSTMPIGPTPAGIPLFDHDRLIAVRRRLGSFATPAETEKAALEQRENRLKSQIS